MSVDEFILWVLWAAVVKSRERVRWAEATLYVAQVEATFALGDAALARSA